jgi:hypothetical protein
VSEAVKRAVAERERAMEAADAAPVMSTVQMAQLKSLIAEASATQGPIAVFIRPCAP